MAYSFQDHVIPMICECLMPFFHNFEDGLRVNDLTASLQSKLEVNEETTTTRVEDITMTR